MEHLLEIKDLKVEFPSKAGNIHAVNGVNLYVDEGEILGVVGESGCGKSVTLSNVLGPGSGHPGRKADYGDAPGA